jgi:hypothetical protein
VQEVPRLARGLAGGFIYHVINRGNGRQEVFHEDKEYEAFTELMAEAKTMYEVGPEKRGQATITEHKVYLFYLR